MEARPGKTARADVRRTRESQERARNAAATIAGLTSTLADAIERRDRAGRSMFVTGAMPITVQRALGVQRPRMVSLRRQWATDALFAFGEQTEASLRLMEMTDRPAYLSLIAEWERKVPPGFVPVDNAEEVAVEAAGWVAALNAELTAAIETRNTAMIKMFAAGARPLDVASAGGLTRARAAQMGLLVRDRG